MNSNLVESIYKLLKSNGDILPDDINESYNYIEDGSMDSFSLMTFFSDVEEEFFIQITPDELSDASSHTISGLHSLIVRKSQDNK